MLRSALDIAAVAAFAFLLAGWSERAVAQLRLGTPETIEMIDQVTGNPEKGCGLRADYQFTDSVIRVEMLASRAEKGVNFAIQAYSPQSVTPSMQDIWLKTPTYFTVGMFSIGRIGASMQRASSKPREGSRQKPRRRFSGSSLKAGRRSRSCSRACCRIRACPLHCPNPCRRRWQRRSWRAAPI